MGGQYEVLSEGQVEHFLEKGYLTVKGCLDPDLASQWTDQAYERLGYDKSDSATWKKDIVWMYPENRRPVSDISETAWQAICDIVGGEDRIDDQVMGVEGHFGKINSFTWTDTFIVNFTHGADQPWEAISSESGRWHKDGAYFRHFLDSREEALLTILYWSDVNPQGGGTFIAPDSVKHVARFLADHPEGVSPSDIPIKDLIGQCDAFVEITGEVGDFIILHPFMLHSSSQNVSGNPRFMTNPPVVLREPMDFNREDPAEFSLLEKATLHALGVKRLDFQPTAPYEAQWELMGDEVQAANEL